MLLNLLSLDSILISKKKELIELFEKYYSFSPSLIVRSSGRMELLGNHTDHQGGKVLVSAINLFLHAAAKVRNDNLIHLVSQGFDDETIDLTDVKIHQEEFGTSKGLVRGMAARLLQLGFLVKGVDLFIQTDVPLGSGVSSSAGFEMLIVETMNQLFNEGNIDPLTRAMIGQYAENHYFNKPSGLLDQMGVSLGGINYIDFYQTHPLRYQTMDNPFDDLHFFLINTGGSHAFLTPHYQAIRQEMESVAALFGHQRLSDVDEQSCFDALSSVKPFTRPTRRAFHYFQENHRVEKGRLAIETQDVSLFLSLLNESGRSSETLLENITFDGDTEQHLYHALNYVQKAPVPCAYRVHGGGFAGTMLVVVFSKYQPELLTYLNSYFPRSSVLEVLPVLHPIISEVIM